MRVVSIDIMRAVAVIFMVLCHFVVYWSSGEAGSFWYFLGNHIIGDLAAPLFLFLVGFSQAISQSRRKVNFILQGVVRGLLIFIIGILVAVGIWGVGSIWAWDILTLIGPAIIVVTLLHKAPSWAIGIIALIVLIFAPFLRSLGDFSAVWPEGFAASTWIASYASGTFVDPISEYVPPSDLKGILLGFFLEAYFPVFPWLTFVLLGYIIGREHVQGRKLASSWWCWGIGFTLMFLGMTFAYLAKDKSYQPEDMSLFVPFSFYPLSITMFLWQFGFCLVLFALMHYMADERAHIPAPIVAYCQTTSRYALTYYVWHHIVMIWPLWVLSWVNNAEFEDYYENLTSEPVALLSGIIFMVVSAFLFHFWDKRFKGAGSFEWLLNKGVTALLPASKA